MDQREGASWVDNSWVGKGLNTDWHGNPSDPGTLPRPNKKEAKKVGITIVLVVGLAGLLQG
jgi:hypothetical protein